MKNLNKRFSSGGVWRGRNQTSSEAEPKDHREKRPMEEEWRTKQTTFFRSVTGVKMH